MKQTLMVSSLLVLIFCSCKHVRVQVGEMKVLDDVIEQQFNCKEVNVKLSNGTDLQVSLINSAYNDSTDAVKQKIADLIGTICPKYIHSAQIKNGTVLFVVYHDFGVVSTRNSHDFPMHIRTN